MVTEKTTTAKGCATFSETTYSGVANSFLHRIVAQPNILPYTYMLKWVIDHLNIS